MSDYLEQLMDDKKDCESQLESSLDHIDLVGYNDVDFQIIDLNLHMIENIENEINSLTE